MRIAFIMGCIYMWFCLSFSWSIDEMSALEKTIGIAYAIAMVPVYFGLTKKLGLREKGE